MRRQPNLKATRSSLPLELRVSRGVQRGEGAWKISTVEALLRGKGRSVGHIEFGFVPESAFAKLLSEGFGARDKEALSTAARGTSLSSSALSEEEALRAWSLWEAKAQGRALTKAELREYIEVHRRVLNENYGGDFSRFERLHVERATVQNVLVEDVYRRRGIATALYKRAAFCLAEWHEMALHASEQQSEAARRLWRSFRKSGERVHFDSLPWGSKVPVLSSLV